jgi:hypothetical protein
LKSTVLGENYFSRRELQAKRTDNILQCHSTL